MDTVKAPAKQAPPLEYPTIYDSFDEFANAFAGRVFPSALIPTVAGSFCSCGISILSGLSGTMPKQIVDKILKERASTDRKLIKEAFVVFSDVDRHPADTKGGNALCRYIKENNLGEILETSPRMNPNTGNQIKMWIWSPPHESLNPRDNLMPVYGKKLVRHNGRLTHVEMSDPRFTEHLNIREA